MLCIIVHVTWFVVCRHGDMLYMFVENKGEGVALEGATGGQNDVKMLEVVEDKIDRLLRKKDGKIYRKRDPQLLVF